MKKRLLKLLKEFRGIFEDYNIQSPVDYYKALCLWVNKNKTIFGEESISFNRLDILTSLDIEKYLSNINCNINLAEIDFDGEKDRIRNINFQTMDGLLMYISETMFEIVTIPCSKVCCYCICGNVRYIKINYNDCEGKVVAECQDCGNIMDINGKKITEKIQNWLPATKEEIDMECLYSSVGRVHDC